MQCGLSSLANAPCWTDGLVGESCLDACLRSGLAYDAVSTSTAAASNEQCLQALRIATSGSNWRDRVQEVDSSKVDTSALACLDFAWAGVSSEGEGPGCWHEKTWAYRCDPSVFPVSGAFSSTGVLLVRRLCACQQPSGAHQDYTVSVAGVQSTLFSPSDLDVVVGDSVVWSGMGSMDELYRVHNDTSCEEHADTLSVSMADGFRHTFSAPGEYYYASRAWCHLDMRGTVSVAYPTAGSSGGDDAAAIAELHSELSRVKDVAQSLASLFSADMLQQPPSECEQALSAYERSVRRMLATLSVAPLTTAPTSTPGGGPCDTTECLSRELQQLRSQVAFLGSLFSEDARVKASVSMSELQSWMGCGEQATQEMEQKVDALEAQVQLLKVTAQALVNMLSPKTAAPTTAPTPRPTLSQSMVPTIGATHQATLAPGSTLPPTEHPTTPHSAISTHYPTTVAPTTAPATAVPTTAVPTTAPLTVPPTSAPTRAPTAASTRVWTFCGEPQVANTAPGWSLKCMHQAVYSSGNIQCLIQCALGFKLKNPKWKWLSCKQRWGGWNYAQTKPGGLSSCMPDPDYTFSPTAPAPEAMRVQTAEAQQPRSPLRNGGVVALRHRASGRFLSVGCTATLVDGATAEYDLWGRLPSEAYFYLEWIEDLNRGQGGRFDHGVQLSSYQDRYPDPVGSNKRAYLRTYPGTARPVLNYNRCVAGKPGPCPNLFHVHRSEVAVEGFYESNPEALALLLQANATLPPESWVVRLHSNPFPSSRWGFVRFDGSGRPDVYRSGHVDERVFTEFQVVPMPAPPKLHERIGCVVNSGKRMWGEAVTPDYQPTLELEPGHCCQRCDEAGRACLAWSFDVLARECWLLSSITETEQDFDWQSGFNDMDPAFDTDGTATHREQHARVGPCPGPGGYTTDVLPPDTSVVIDRESAVVACHALCLDTAGCVSFSLQRALHTPFCTLHSCAAPLQYDAEWDSYVVNVALDSVQFVDHWSFFEPLPDRSLTGTAMTDNVDGDVAGAGTAEHCHALCATHADFAYNCVAWQFWDDTALATAGMDRQDMCVLVHQEQGLRWTGAEVLVEFVGSDADACCRSCAYHGVACHSWTHANSTRQCTLMAYASLGETDVVPSGGLGLVVDGDASVVSGLGTYHLPSSPACRLFSRVDEEVEYDPGYTIGKTTRWTAPPVVDVLEQESREERIDRLEVMMGALLHTSMLAQTTAERRVRSEGGSGVTHSRHQMNTGLEPYYAEQTSGFAFMNMHNHANNRNTLGLGEFSAVINGVEFTTRHNDYQLFMPSKHSTSYHATQEVPFPAVPQRVLDIREEGLQMGLDEDDIVLQEIQEVQQWFKAWKDQNPSVPMADGVIRDYRPHFRPVLVYMEATWVRGLKRRGQRGDNDELIEPFDSDRHFVDAASWTELYEKIRFLENGGKKQKDENIPYLPSAVRSVEQVVVNGTRKYRAEFANWEYRIAAHPVSRDIPLSRLRVARQLSTQLQGKAYSHEQMWWRDDARFELNPVDKDGWAEGPQKGPVLLDELMAEVPGKNNYGGMLLDHMREQNGYCEWRDKGAFSFDRGLKNAFCDRMNLNAAYYSRFYTRTDKDAGGRVQVRRSFHDPTMWAALTSHERVSGLSLSYRDKDHCNTTVPESTTQRWSYSIPLEIVYTTPLSRWNPYNIELNVTSSRVLSGGRTGRCSSGTDPSCLKKALYGNSDAHFYHTPAAFFGNEAEKDPADTAISGVVWTLDKKGRPRPCKASGHWVFFPSIGGVGAMRQRFPIAPVHEHTSAAYKELKAFQKIMLTDPSQLFDNSVQLRLSLGNSDHTHYITVSAADVQTASSGVKLPHGIESTEDGGHTHWVWNVVLEEGLWTGDVDVGTDGHYHGIEQPYA